MSKHIVAIGGGTGTFTVLSGLKKYPVNLTAIVSMADSGGSTGRLRDELGVLPPGDVRQCLVALSQSPRLRDLFSYRFSTGTFKGHNFGNIFLAALEKVTGSFKEAVLESAKILNISGAVIPVTEDKVHLWVELENGQVVKTEDNVDRVVGFDGNLRISRAYLKPHARITPEAKKAILGADLIVIGPGDLYTSIVPNLVVLGLKEAIKQSHAKCVYVCNLMSKFGQTQGFGVIDHLAVIEKYLGKNRVNWVLYNTQKPSQNILGAYKKEKGHFIEFDGIGALRGAQFIGQNLLNTKIVQHVKSDALKRSLIRHNSEKLAKEIMRIL